MYSSGIMKIDFHHDKNMQENISIFYQLLHQFRSILYRIFAGKGLGKKFPFLWQIYDSLVRFFAPKRFIHRVNGQLILIDLEEPHYHFRRILEDYAYLDEYEPNTVKKLKEILKKGDIVVDVGASIGELTLTMSELVGENGRVYAIEPTPVCFYYLCENIKLNNRRNIFPYQVGAWDKDELIRVQPKLARPYWANGIRLDDLLSWLGVSRVDFIKIDIDGGEPWALRGLTKTIEKNPHLKMIIEYYPKYIKAAGGEPEEVMRILDKYFRHSPIEGDYGDGYWNFYCERKS